MVLDTSTVLMPITRPGSGESWLRELWQDGTIEPLISKDTRAELIRALQYPRFGLTNEQIASTAEIYLAYCTEVVIPEPPPTVPSCRDRTDEPFLTLAYQAKAAGVFPLCIVSKDRDLLSVAGQSEIPIIKPAELRNWLP